MCVLRIAGRTFDPNAVLALSACRVVRSGEPHKKTQPNGARWEASGITVVVSDAPWTDRTSQVRDAARFSISNSQLLQNLMASGTVDDMRLDFPVELRIHGNVVAQFEFLPAALVEKAAVCGVGHEALH